MIIAKWKNDCWELRDVPTRGKSPIIMLKDHFVTSTLKGAIEEINNRRQKVCKNSKKNPEKK